MKIRERGVLPESNIYFHTPNESDKKLFFVPTSCGHYFCTSGYDVIRENYGNFLLQQVLRGRAYVLVNGRRIILGENDIFLLDCYHRHSYGIQNEKSPLETLWVHFEGPQAHSYFKSIAGAANCVVLKPRDPQTIYNNLNLVYQQFHEQHGINNILNNKYIINILTEYLLAGGREDEKRVIKADLLAYIADNIQKPLNVAGLAKMAALSPYYFIRQFTRETGYTPHKYVLLARINTAKHYLKSSNLSTKEIAFACGFTSDSSFCIAFRRMEGMSPLAYRAGEQGAK